ncbi:MAG: hypothetical protein IKE24_01685 [Clostridia bacterium]|nr:hypothetical protein [Clostridia bacterium]
MIFGRTGARQAGQAPQEGAGNGQAAQGYNMQQPQATPWQTGGGTPLAGSYPTQPAGTGYSGYTPGAGASGGYPAAGSYAQQVQAAYQQARNPYAQPAQPAQQGMGYGPGGYAQPGYGQTGPSYGQQAGVYPGQGTGGYAGQPAGYNGYAAAGQGTGGYQGAAGYPGGYAQQGPSYAGGNMGFPQGYGAQAGGYPGQGTGGYAYPQMQQGQNQGGYNNPYAQMGRNQSQGAQGQPQDYSRQIPLNGGGYVPQQVPVKKQPFVFNEGMLILLGGVLLALFAVGLFVPGAKALLWVFTALAVGSIVLFYVKPLVTGNRRLCYTIIFAILSVVALLSVTGILAGARGTRQGQPENTPETVAAGSGTSAASSAGAGQVVDPLTGNVISAVPQTEATATPSPEPSEDNGATERLETFFRYWSAGMQDEMLNLCAPSWQSSVDNPKTALFGLLANRRPLDYTVENITGTSESTSRTVTVTSTIDRNNGKDPVKYRLSVLMVKEGDQWYVDPQSLKTYESAETPDPATQATPTPSPTPAADANTILYYNPDGGSKYHLDANCKSVHAKYLPLKGHFTYGEIEKDQYKSLSPCNVCAAPLRP